MAAVAQGRTPLTSAVCPLASDSGTLNLLGGPASTGRTGINGTATELAVDGMRRLLHEARTDYDVIILDLGVLSAGRQSAIGAALAERVLVITAACTRRKYFDTAIAMLDRLAPERFLVVMNRALPADPALAKADPAKESGLEWLRRSLGQFSRYMKRRPQHE